ncbi:glycosyltransferase family 2 protein [Pseudooceanicola marinus]|uniref:glycosyltransferase family 2 protein n=1 Tax=Pseudooceanicola marinus TaxID=396013 RepID=UPI001CD6F03A|nr:glycosyltransferase family 2 protein [Pseudooceanicola marinus]MCA1336117.1 glycosyltransferase family 2 protein [Pseudooceanicola marinus]
MTPDAGAGDAGPPPALSLGRRYRLRLLRRRLLYRALRARHRLRPVADRTEAITPEAVLAVTCLRNEALRLPFFLDHYRRLGVDHFLIVDNGSDDGSAALLADQPDVSLWQTADSYRDSRFGMDWLGWLLMRHGSGHWCLTVDADELLVWPGHEAEGLAVLTARLESAGQSALGALMLDLYPEGPLDGVAYWPGQNPAEVLTGFDPGPYRACWQPRHGNLWVQGGMRERVFFAETPAQGPTLNKLPLVRWHWRQAYLNSTHALLPASLNAAYRGPAGPGPSGVLLHTKFLPDSPARAAEERQRQQHFGDPAAFDPYYSAVSAAPDAWHAGTCRYTGPDLLAQLGLMRRD